MPEPTIPGHSHQGHDNNPVSNGSNEPEEITSIESLPGQARAALQQLEKWLKSHARVPVFAIAGKNSSKLTEVAQIFAMAKGGDYVQLSKYIGNKVLGDRSLRTEWISPYSLADTILSLAEKCSESFLIVDDWEVALGLVKHNTGPSAPKEILSVLVYRPVSKPIVLVLPVGPDSFGSTSEIRNIMETQGRLRVVELEDTESW